MQITARNRFWLRPLFTFLGFCGLLLGICSVYGGTVVIKQSGPESGKLLGGIICCATGVVIILLGVVAFFLNCVRMIDGV